MVAVVAQQTANVACLVIVIYRELVWFATLVQLGFRSAADGAEVVLSFGQPLVLFGGDAVGSLQVAGAHPLLAVVPGVFGSGRRVLALPATGAPAAIEVTFQIPFRHTESLVEQVFVETWFPRAFHPYRFSVA